MKQCCMRIAQDPESRQTECLFSMKISHEKSHEKSHENLILPSSDRTISQLFLWQLAAHHHHRRC